MRNTLLPLWLSNVTLDWYEDGDDPSGEDSTDTPNADNPPADDDDEPAPTKEDVARLKRALEAERSETRRLKPFERELTKAQKAKQDKELAEKDAVAAAEKRAEESVERVAKLGAAFRNAALVAAIEREASAQGFIDTGDAITLVDRSSITVDQEEDTPETVSVDAESVKKAVAALAKRKAHLVRKGTEDGEATGSTFGGQKRTKQQVSDDDLRKKYPALGRF